MSSLSTCQCCVSKACGVCSLSVAHRRLKTVSHLVEPINKIISKLHVLQDARLQGPATAIRGLHEDLQQLASQEAANAAANLGLDANFTAAITAAQVRLEAFACCQSSSWTPYLIPIDSKSDHTPFIVAGCCVLLFDD